MTSARVTVHGLAKGGGVPSWGRHAAASDPLAAWALELVGARNQRLPRLDRPALSALVAAQLVMEDGAAPGALVVAVEDGSAAADRAYWATARERGGAEASPTRFAATLPSAVAGELAMTFALRGPCIVVAGAGAFDAPLLRAAGAASGGCLHVRLRGWDTGTDGETLAALEWGGGTLRQPGTSLRSPGLPFRPMTPPLVPASHDALRAELVTLISDDTRRDPVDPATISDATPCIGGSLLVDSLDVLEVVVAIDRVYGVSLRDGDVGRSVFATMGTLTGFVEKHRVR